MRVSRDSLKIFYILLGLTVILLLFGIIMVFSASQTSAFRDYGDSLYFLKKQAFWGAIGIIMLLFFAFYDYRKLQRRSGLLLITAIILLGLVLIPGMGKTVNGAQRWLSGPVSIQPSEFAKLAFVIYAADLLTRKASRLKEFKHLTVPLIPILLLLCGLILKEPDLGTSLTICFIGLTAMFVAGARFHHVAAMAITGSSLVMALIMSSGYQRARFFAFLDPWADPQGKGFQIIQSLIAFGSGGTTGLGVGMSRQKFSYLPAAHTDFIFAIIGEELGLAGSLFLIFLLLIFVVTGYMVARRATDPFGRILAASIVAMVTGQAILNMAAVTGMVPITGIPLPFISAGGSSLIVLLSSIGILLNIALTNKGWAVAGKPKSADQRRRHGRPRVSGPSSGRRARALS